MNESIFSALGIEPFHVAMLVPRHSAAEQKSPGKTITEGSMAHTLARNMPYVAGHVTYSDLRSLNRGFVFTALRDPRKRVISLFTYAVKRANSEKVVRNRPRLGRFADMGFYDFIGYRKPMNEAAALLLGDIGEFAALAQEQARGDPSREFVGIIEDGLRRLDVIYACTNQEILDDLHARGLIPQTKEVWKNKSEGSVDFGRLGSRQEFLETLDRATWQDVLAYQAAQRLFPETMRVPLSSDEEILSEVEHRFGARFGAG